MSKNGKLLFRGYNPYITSNFGNRVHPITGITTMHYGVDYGTEDGIVLDTGFSNISGNFVYIK